MKRVFPVVLLAVGVSFAGWNSISAGYGVWRATRALDGFARLNLSYRAGEFHGLSISTTYNFTDRLSLTGYLPHVTSIRRTDQGNQSRQRVTDLRLDIYHRPLPGLKLKLGTAWPTLYESAGDPWLASGSITANTSIQYNKNVGLAHEVFGSAELEAVLTSSRTGTGGLRWGYDLGGVRRLLNGHRLKLGLSDYFKYVRYRQSDGSYGDPYFQRVISGFGDIWWSLNDRWGLSGYADIPFWGHRSSAGNSVSIKATWKFRDYVWVEE